MKISIIIPVFKEQETITRVLEKIQASVKTKNEIIIVYDSQNDPTLPVVNRYISSTKNKTIKLVQNSVRTGKGVMNAIKTGFNNTKGIAIVVVMADMSDDLSQIDKMYSLIQKGNDIVCASRYMKGGKKIGGPFIKSLLSRTAGLTLHWFFGIPTHDSTNAYKMYRKSIFKKISIESSGGFEYSMEIV